MRRLQARLRDERGMTLVMVATGLVAFLSATMLAVDVGMLMVARTEAQSSADAGALAGAVALAFDDYNDRSATGPAVRNAIATATATDNGMMNRQVSVLPEDVTFPVHSDTRARAAQHRARKPAFHLHRSDVRHQHRRHGSGRHSRGLAGERDDLREAVHRSRQVDRAADAAVGPGRHIRCVRQQRESAGRSRHLHSARSDRLYRLQLQHRSRHAHHLEGRRPAPTSRRASTFRIPSAA